MSKHMTMGEAVRRIAEAERQLKAGNIDKAIEATPCPECKKKLEAMRKSLDR